MRQIREVLRLKHACGRSHREISASVAISKGSVHDYLTRAEKAGLTWAEAEKLSDSEVEQRLFRFLDRNEPSKRAAIDFEWVRRELHRDGVTLQLLWEEYREAVKKSAETSRPYAYSQFCELYSGYRNKLPVVMRQTHRAGEKAFVDYSGKKPHVVDGETGEVIEVELFVIVLGASNYTYAEATRSQQLPDFVASHVRAFSYFGCVSQIIVPDQLRSAVKGPHRYDPEINQTYAELARHYGFAPIPARPRKPRDKAKVEVGVQIAQRWILARLRNRTFFSLDELNIAIADLLEDLNTRRFIKLDGCRRSLFETVDRPAMKALPPSPYVLADWKRAKVNIDYHYVYDDRFYSVHHTLVGQEVEVCATAATVEALLDRKRIASYPRNYGPKGSATTLEEHRPKSHRDYGAWPPSRMVSWASSVGPETGHVVTAILEEHPHPERGFRACLALIRQSKKYGEVRMEAACARAITIGSPTRKSVEMILKRGLDRLPLEPRADAQQPTLPIVHEHLRGGDYFDTESRTPRPPKTNPSGDGTGTLH